MAIARVHTWSAGEVLLASDLNSEFNNVLTNGSDLVSPFTKAISMGGFALNFDAANTIALTATTSGVILTGGTIREPTEDTLTAHAGGTQAAAQALSAAKKYHRISVCATATDSVALPTSTAGQAHFIRNDGAAAAQVFGTTPDTINSVATATGVPLAAGVGTWYVCTTAGNWTTGPLVSVSGNFPVTFTATASTALTLPTSGTVVTKDSTDILTNKTYDTAGSGNVFKINTNAVSAVTGTGATAVLSASPTFTGSPLAPTQTAADNSTKIATTAYVDTAIVFAKLNSGSVSAAATLDIVMTAYTAYPHKLLVFDLIPATDATTLFFRTSTDGGSTYDAGAGNYSHGGWYADDNGSTAAQNSSSSTEIIISQANSVGNGATEGVSGQVFMPNTTSTAKWPRISFASSLIDSSATPRVVDVRGSGTRRAAQDTDAIRVLFSSGNIASGTWKLYGYV